MSASPQLMTPVIVYPDSDGKRMADNTLQWDWIAKLKGNLEALFLDRPDVFVGGDLLWYPVEGEPQVRAAPDVLVAFGRPKGYRGSYRQWEEDNVPVTVAFEVLSPGNSYREMIDKAFFYEEHGVEEYYVYDPEEVALEVYLRQGEVFRREHKVDGFESPRLGVRFHFPPGLEMAVFSPDGRPFLSHEALAALQRLTGRRADDEKRRADDEKRRADDEKRRADDEKRRADTAERRLARVVELARKARLGHATPSELAELEQLEAEPLP